MPMTHLAMAQRRFSTIFLVVLLAVLKRTIRSQNTLPTIAPPIATGPTVLRLHYTAIPEDPHLIPTLLSPQIPKIVVWHAS